MADKITLEQKPTLMAAIGTEYAIVQAAQQEVRKLEILLVPRIQQIVTNFGAGPHRMPLPVEVPDESNPGKVKTVMRTYFVSFRKSGDVWAFNAVDADSVT